MKIFSYLGATLFLIIAVINPQVARAQNDGDEFLAEGFEDGEEALDPNQELDMDYFVDKLSPHGEWFETDKYGWVWQPDGLPDDWRPFTYGHWVYTDFGWTWVSSFPWGWAAFHYGAWANMEELGWVWVPAGIWSPARVVWRYHTEYVGWAPIVAGYDYWGGWDAYPVYYTHWSFIGWAFFCHAHLWHHLIHHHHSHWHFHHSHYPSACGSHSGPACHHGPSPRKVSEASGQPVVRHRVTGRRSKPQSTHYKKKPRRRSQKTTRSPSRTGRRKLTRTVSLGERNTPPRSRPSKVNRPTSQRRSHPTNRTRQSSSRRSSSTKRSPRNAPSASRSPSSSRSSSSSNYSAPSRRSSSSSRPSSTRRSSSSRKSSSSSSSSSGKSRSSSSSSRSSSKSSSSGGSRSSSRSSGSKRK